MIIIAVFQFLSDSRVDVSDCFWLPQSVVKHTKQLEEVCIPGRRRVVRFKLRHARVDAGAFIPPYVDDFDAGTILFHAQHACIALKCRLASQSLRLKYWRRNRMYTHAFLMIYQ